MQGRGTVVVNAKLSAWDIYRFQVNHALSRFWLVLLVPGLIAIAAAFLWVAAHIGASTSPEHAADADRILVNALPLLGVFGFMFLVAPYFSALSAAKNPNIRSGSRYTV